MKSSSLNVGNDFGQIKSTKFKPLQKVSDFDILKQLEKAKYLEFMQSEIEEMCETFSIEESHLRCLIRSAKKENGSF